MKKNPVLTSISASHPSPPDADRTKMLAVDPCDTCHFFSEDGICADALHFVNKQGESVCRYHPDAKRFDPSKTEAAEEVEKFIRCPWCEESLIDDEDGPTSVRRIVLQVLDSVEVRRLKKFAVWQYLTKNNFDGLCCPETDCGCFTNHLFPCCRISPNCRPGHAVAIGNTGEYEIREGES